MLKSVLFQIHWLIGITAGLVLAVVGFTGGVLSFEDEIVQSLNSGVLPVEVRSAPKLTPQQLVDAVKRTTPDARVASVSLAGDPESSSVVGLAPTGQGRGKRVMLDPYDGTVLPDPSGRGFFRAVEQVHRFLLLPGGNQGIGKTIVGIATLTLVFLALSGLYLRWPKRSLNWRAWFAINLKRRGRPLWWNLHAVVGVYVFLAYLVMALTGLWWSFDWYKNGLSLALTGKPAAQQGGQGGPPSSDGLPDVALGPVWDGFTAATGSAYETANLSLPGKAGDPVQIRFLATGAEHERAFDQMMLDPATGEVQAWDKFAEKDFGERLYGSVFPLHSGSYFGLVGSVLWMLASLAMPVFFVTGWLLYLGRRRHKRVRRARAIEEGRLAAVPAE